MRGFGLTLCTTLPAALALSAAMVFGGARPAAAEWSLKEAARPYEGVTIRVIGEALPPLESLDQQKSAFEEETGIKVEVEQHAFDQVIQKTTADFVGRTGFYDAVLNPIMRVPALVVNGWAQPLEIYLDDPALGDPDFAVTEQVLSEDWLNASLAHEGKLYGVPFSAHTIYLNWRYDLFEHPEEQAAFKAAYDYELPSPPVTLQELWDTSEFFTRAAGEKLAGHVLEQPFYGITLSGKRHVSMIYNFYNILYAYDGLVVDSASGPEYGPVVINNDEGVAALEFYRDLLTGFGPPGSLTYTWDEQLAAIQSGLAAQALLWADASYAMAHDEDQSTVAGRVAFSGTPIGARKIVNLHQWGMFIPTTSKNPEAAALFLQWTQRPDVQARLMSTGSIALTESAYHEESVKALDYAATNHYLLSGRVPEYEGTPAYRSPGEAHGVPRRYAEAADPVTGRTQPVVFKLENFPEYATVEEILMKHLSAILAGQMEPKEGLDRAVEEIYAEVPALAEHRP